jgi:hypothetical protein
MRYMMTSGSNPLFDISRQLVSGKAARPAKIMEKMADEARSSSVLDLACPGYSGDLSRGETQANAVFQSPALPCLYCL